MPTISDELARQYARDNRAAADISRLVAAARVPGTRIPPAGVWAGIRRVLEGQLTFCPPYTRGGDAQVLGWCLRHRPGSFTLLADAVTGTGPVVEPDEGWSDGRDYRLPGGEASALGYLADAASMTGWERRGTMIAGRLVVAAVRLRVVPARLSGDELARIRKGEPCGQVIPGLTRTLRSAVVSWPGDPAVTAHAVLARPGGQLFGLADEDVAPGLVDHLAGLRHSRGVAWG
jgi:hypothetical protein